jgi:hypothetical protein
MEDLIKNDATFELYHNSEGGQLLNNRTLMSYPSERSSFQVDLGSEDYSNFEKRAKKPKAPKVPKEKRDRPKFDPEKIAGLITAGAGAVSSVDTTIKSLQDDNDPKLKELCGRKPIFKKKSYDECVEGYRKVKLEELKNQGNTKTDGTTTEGTTTEDSKPKNKNTKILIGVGIGVAVIVTVFIGFKQGWFGKKAG